MQILLMLFIAREAFYGHLNHLASKAKDFYTAKRIFELVESLLVSLNSVISQFPTIS